MTGQYALQDVAVIVTCTLSMVGSLFIIVSFALFKDFQNSQSRRLLVLLSFCDFMTAVAYLVRLGPMTPEDEAQPSTATICHLQSALNIYANMASFFWTDFISLFVLLSRKYGMKQASRAIPFFHIISWGVPLISVSVVGGFGAWGYDNGAATADWCWIDGDRSFYWHIIAGKGVEWMSYFFVTIIYICVFIDLRKASDQQLLLAHRGGTNWKITEKKLLAIPVIFIILRFPGTFRTVYLMFNPDNPTRFGWIVVLQAIGDSGQGLANGLLFGVFTEKVRSYYYKLLGRCTRQDKAVVNESSNGLGLYSKPNPSQHPPYSP